MPLFNRFSLKRDSFWVNLAISFLINCLVAFAMFFFANVNRWSWADIFSGVQLIGFSVFIAYSLIFWLFRHSFWLVIGPTWASAMGIFFASHLAQQLGWVDVTGIAAQDFRAVMRAFFTGIMINYLLFFRDKSDLAQRSYQQEKLAHLAAEQQANTATLKMLQAQIEPHFLFNTLANVLSLMESNVEQARLMLKHFIAYLRASLSRTRSEGATFKDEIEMLRAYLSILQIRMGKRLQYQFEVAPEVLNIAFPPMLLQPLVENAVKHGLEPKIEGGDVKVTAYTEEGKLKITVADSGLGLRATQSKGGVGLSNVRERIQTLYQGKGKLDMFENTPSGVKIVLEIPL